MLTYVILSLLCTHARGNVDNPMLRIGLVRSFAGATSISVSVPAGVRLTDPLDSTLLEGPAEWTVTASEDHVSVSTPDGHGLIGGPILRLVPKDGNDSDLITVSAGKTRRKYRGVVEFQRGAGDSGTKRSVVAINELPLEEYLRGVVPAEMSDTGPIEALKAQAIAARSYALINRGRYRTRGYDVSDAQDCQVYNGAGAEKASTDLAVRDTAGQVLVRNDALVLADYYDDCGGMTS